MFRKSAGSLIGYAELYPLVSTTYHMFDQFRQIFKPYFQIYLALRTVTWLGLVLKHAMSHDFALSFFFLFHYGFHGSSI